MTKDKKPKYEFVNEDGDENLQPSKRKINKTMEVTESFTMYDVLAYTMKMEKAIEDKEKEIDGLRSMLSAYQKEIDLIESEMEITKMDEEYHKNIHEKLIAEEKEKKENEENI